MKTACKSLFETKSKLLKLFVVWPENLHDLHLRDTGKQRARTSQLNMNKMQTENQATCKNKPFIIYSVLILLN